MQNLIITTPEQLEALMKSIIKAEFCSLLKELQGEENQLMTTSEVAQLFSVSKVTIYKWRKQGILPFRFVNSRVRYLRAEVMEVLESK